MLQGLSGLRQPVSRSYPGANETIFEIRTSNRSDPCVRATHLMKTVSQGPSILVGLIVDMVPWWCMWKGSSDSPQNSYLYPIVIWWIVLRKAAAEKKRPRVVLITWTADTWWRLVSIWGGWLSGFGWLQILFNIHGIWRLLSGLPHPWK